MTIRMPDEGEDAELVPITVRAFEVIKLREFNRGFCQGIGIAIFITFFVLILVVVGGKS